MNWRILAVFLAGPAAWCQPAAPPAFEVASIKPAAPCCAQGQWRGNKVGADRLDFQYATLWYCVTFAYGVKNYQVDGPDWLKDARFDIIAKAPEGTRREQLPAMMQTLLAERLELKAHRETRDIPGLALVVGKNGPKLKQAAADSGDGMGGAQVGMSATSEGAERMEVKGGTMSTLVNTLISLLGRPVFDKTGLEGRYDFVLEFSRNGTGGVGVPQGYNSAPSMPAPGGAEPGISIYTAIQLLGLRLEQQKFPMDVIVVDHAARTPTAN